MEAVVLQKRLMPLFILKLISTITFGIFYSSLTLLMVHTFNLPATMATSIAALFFGFHYSSQLIGGKVGDYINNYRYLFIVGKVFKLLCVLVLIYSIEHREYMYFGLGCFFVDSMFGITSENMMLTKLFAKSEVKERHSACIKGYMWNNAGFMGAFLISGAIYRFIGIDSLLYISAFFSFLTLAYAILFIRDIQHNASPISVQSNMILGLSILLVVTITSKLLSACHFTREIVLLVTFCAGVALFIKTAKGGYGKDTNNILKFFTYVGLSVVFWTVYMLGPTFVALFVDRIVDTNIWGFNVPPQWLKIVDGVIIITTGTWLSNQIKNNKLGSNRPALYVIGIVCAFFALFILSVCLSLYTNEAKVSFLWIICTLIVLSFGEVFISPASMALVGEYIPKKEQGLYTGINKVVIGVSVVLAGMLSEKILIPAFEMNQKVGGHYNSAPIFLFIIILGIVIGYFVFDRQLCRRDNYHKIRDLKGQQYG